MSVLGTNRTDDSSRIFMDTRNRPKRVYTLLLVLSPGSHHYGSSPAYTLEQLDEAARFIPMCQRLDRIWPGAGILTCFPFTASD